MDTEEFEDCPSCGQRFLQPQAAACGWCGFFYTCEELDEVDQQVDAIRARYENA
jgi:hypothetical protein